MPVMSISLYYRRLLYWAAWVTFVSTVYTPYVPVYPKTHQQCLPVLLFHSSHYCSSQSTSYVNRIVVVILVVVISMSPSYVNRILHAGLKTDVYHPSSTDLPHIISIISYRVWPRLQREWGFHSGFDFFIYKSSIRSTILLLTVSITQVSGERNFLKPTIVPGNLSWGLLTYKRRCL